ncbi:MAG TPA: hypothetical protein VJB70_04200 [Candidatus Paceibacterota bacterium]
MTKPRSADDAIVGKIVGYTLVQESPPDWKKVRTTFTSLAALLNHPTGDEGQEFFTRFELPDGSIEEDGGIPVDGRENEIGKLAYRVPCSHCKKPTWWKGLKPQGRVTCADCSETKN